MLPTITPPLERDIATHDYRAEAEECRRIGRLPVNPYMCPDHEGISTAIGLRDLLDCSLDPGGAGGALFLVGLRSCSIDDIITALKLRDETYQRYRDIQLRKVAAV